MSDKNTEKLEKLINIFVNDVGEEYFVNLRKIYKVLQGTLLNKKYVENLTKEKFNSLVNENKFLFNYFDNFVNNFHLIEYENCEFHSPNQGEIEIFYSTIFKTIFETDKNLIQHSLLEKDFNEASEPDKKELYYIMDEFWCLHFPIPILANLKSPKFNHYNTILEMFDIKFGYELSDRDINFIKNIVQKRKETEIKNIRTGIFFFHFCQWYKEEYIEKIQIENHHTIKNAELTNLNSKEIYLLGENGAGKTILLQSIFYAVNGKKPEKLTTKCFPFNKHKFTKQKIYAYGVHRNRITTSREKLKAEFHTLFSNDAELNDPLVWLQQLKIKELEKDETGISFKVVENFLIDLLERNVEIKVRGGKIVFTENNSQDIGFNQLATGYQTVLIWLVDLIIRMSENQKYITHLQHFKGIVLIDELDLFLHPKWAYKIMKKLRNWFPRIKFIISTHSPVLILGASEDATIYKVYKNEKGETQVSEPYNFSDYKHLTSNAFLTAPFLFDLEFSGTREMKDKDFYKNKLDTSEHFNIYKINQAVEKRVKEIRKEKNIQITEENIENWVNQAIAKLEEDEK